MHIRDGLVDAKHYQAMGDAIWLYLYLHKRCAQKTGLVKCYRHQDAAAALGLSVPTIKRYMERLKAGGYVVTTRGYNHLSVQITRYEWQEGRRGHLAEPPSEVSEEILQPPSEVSELAPLDAAEAGEKYQTCAREVSKSLARTDSPLSQRGTITTPNGVGTDVPPPPAQNHEPPSPACEKQETTSAPWLIAEALLKAQNRVPTRAAVSRLLKAVSEHVTDAYRDHPQKPRVPDALACIAYLLTDPWVAEKRGRVTARKLGDELGPWLAAGKPSAWEPFSRDKATGPVTPATVDGKPAWAENPPSVAFDPDVEKRRRQFIDYWGGPPWLLTADRKAEAVAAGCLSESRR